MQSRRNQLYIFVVKIVTVVQTTSNLLLIIPLKA